MRRRAGLSAIVAATVALVESACGGGPSQAVPADAPTPPSTVHAPSGEPIPIVIDSSPTVSDVGALAYLATHPDVALRAVTLAGTGESRSAAATSNTLAILERLGHAPVPVACGSEVPVGPGAEWPAEWRDAADRLDPLGLPAVETEPIDGGATALLTETAASVDGLVVVALGPLTNLAEAVAADPAFADGVDRVVTMGGAFNVPGNAPNGSAEWNYIVDPTAVDAVLRSGIPVTMVPLDATDAMPADRSLFDRLAESDSPAAHLVAQLWSVARPWESGLFLWDELTAVVAVDPSMVTISDQSVAIIIDGDDAGRTVVDPHGTTVQIATAPDRRRVEAALVERLTAEDGG